MRLSERKIDKLLIFSIRIGVVIAANLAAGAPNATSAVARQASPTVSNMQAAMASAGDLEPWVRKSKAG